MRIQFHYLWNKFKDMLDAITTKEGGRKVPLIEIKVFEGELTPEQTKDLIQKITDAIAAVESEKLRDVTWVIVNEIKSGNWGIGGTALGLADVKKIIQAA